MNPLNRRQAAAVLASSLLGCSSPVRRASPAPAHHADIVVAADGSGQFRSVHQAVQSIPKDNRERRVVHVKPGVYRERVRIDAPRVTLRGAGRADTRIEFSHPASAPLDAWGRAVLDIGPGAHDLVLEQLTIENTHPVVGPHAFAVLGYADRTLIQDCDLLSWGNDTLALWRGAARAEDAAYAASPGTRALARHGGRYHHARLNVRGSVDFVCPRGWCHLTDSTLTQVNPGATAAVWHDGRDDADKKFVLHQVRFDGPPGFYLARHHHDAQFYFIACRFSERLRDQPPYRVRYPLTPGATPTQADLDNNQRLALGNRYDTRHYFFDCHRDGGDLAWHRDNLVDAPGAPQPGQLSAAWTFAGSWDPERDDPPQLLALQGSGNTLELLFSESVTLQGQPLLPLADGRRVQVLGGSGGDTLRCRVVDAREPPGPGGALIASEAASRPRQIHLTR